MPSYSYKALKPDSSVVEGTREASSKAEVISMISQSGWQAVSVKAIAGKSAKGRERKKVEKKKTVSTGSSQSSKEGISLSPKQVIFFTEELSDLLGADVPLLQALHSIAGRSSADKVGEVAALCRDEVKQGTKLAMALKKSSPAFSDLYCNLVAAGEVSGGLGQILQRQVAYLRTIAELKNRLIVALIYPAFLLFFGLLVSGIFLFYLVPRLEQFVTASGGDLPAIAKFVINLGNFLQSYWLPIIVLLVVSIFLGQWMLQRPGNQRRWDEWKLQIPLLGNLLTTRFNVQFSETLANLLQNGLPLAKALALVENTSGNIYIREKLGELREENTEGTRLHTGMKKAGVFESGLVDMVRIGDQTGNLAGSLSKAGARLDREFSYSIERINAFIQPVILLVMAIVVAIMAMTMISLINQTTSALQGM